MGSEEDDESLKSVDELENITQAEAKTFEDPSFSLSAQLISNLGKQGLTVPTQVQLEVISKIRDERGNDLCVNAPTGSGKTLAYALPIVQVRNYAQG
jgi:superfamily II DNA/RNA helicase